MKPTASLLAPGGRPLGRRARRQAETRARIVRAALDLFARQGFSSTTVEQITEAADVGKGTFFNYFPSKEHVLAGFGELQIGKVQSALDEARNESKPAREVWRRLVRELAKEPGRSPSLVRGLLVANLSRDPVLKLMRRNLARGRQLLAQVIAKGQERGEIRADVKPAHMARLLQQTFFGAIFLWALHPSVQLSAWLDTTFDVFWSGVAAQARPEIESGEKRR